MKIRHVIGGEEIDSIDGATYDDIDPYTRQSYATVARGGDGDIDAAVTAARRAFDDGPWPRLGFAERGRLLHKFADLIEQHADELAEAESRDMGKPQAVAAGHDVPRSVANIRFFADHARLSLAETFPSDTGHHTYTRYESAGVVAAISPWNFPMMLATWKIAPALAWGNTVVLKPAEDTPRSAAILGRLALAAGIPEGVLNVVLGFGDAGAVLVKDPRVDRITFTGSSLTGRAIASAAATNLTPVSFELGGKGANLVFDDADLDNATDWAIRAAFGNTGQVCLAGSRLFVQRGVYDEFLSRFTAAADAMVLGDPSRQQTALGPLASEKHFAKVSGYLREDKLAGATVVTGGHDHDWFIRPTVLTDVPADAPVQTDEIFGPVVTVTPFDSEPEGVSLANSTPYGLSAMVFSENLHRAHRVSAALRSGNVWVNCFFIRDLRAPFGGVGDSGVGREGGAFSREFFTEPKTVTMNIAG
ncbi:5-carboxymethyl-2-hydroxymuconate semialdehyde dehydrogenase [Kibdelosporangium aridum]|uniref:5-carboxymethyl-2-hydroxymuconate semialdehyde dehydrogenase n=1 Tax=Kibdelosporangium aridum TaxID=2030 RepID=A0A428ZUE5_KIBAR|nr:aldehyde dehydrogenase [Kibdelosporangium aridum]RSM91655.1 5-carboxymethyl-2-hydroxymuconate semialdehyde dehydrogenase [Kibdelosporangium aridum]